jgi:hypothetical protein
MARNEARITAILQQLAASPIDLVGNYDEQGYARLQLEGKTLAYAIPGTERVKLDFATPLVEGAPQWFQKMFEGDDGERFKSGRAKLFVTPKNVKGARALLEWVANQ